MVYSTPSSCATFFGGWPDQIGFSSLSSLKLTFLLMAVYYVYLFYFFNGVVYCVYTIREI